MNRRERTNKEVQILKSVCTQNIKTLKSKKMDGRNNKLNCVYVRSFLFDRQVAFGKNKVPIDSQRPTRSRLSKLGLSDFTRVEKSSSLSTAHARFNSCTSVPLLGLFIPLRPGRYVLPTKAHSFCLPWFFNKRLKTFKETKVH